jgi:hypothetical protein
MTENFMKTLGCIISVDILLVDYVEYDSKGLMSLLFAALESQSTQIPGTATFQYR